MGSCLSKVTAPRTPIVEKSDGGLNDYQARYIEDRVIGEGEYGKVKICHDMKTNEVCAVKELVKGVQFKDNTLYSPVKPHILLRECAILRELKGEHHTLKLLNVYETPSAVLIVTEYYAGGDLTFWLANSTNELRTETVSRIAYQLLDALVHCNNHHIIHRDIKPDNIMFISTKPESELRLIDFGGSLMVEESVAEEEEALNEFMGSAFYTSPEMFQRTYTAKTDVWSLGVTFYVLVAGYPADKLQKAFNILHNNKKESRIATLPNIPTDLPESFYKLLEDMLVFRHKSRKAVTDIINSEFVQFHKFHDETSEIPLADILQNAGESVNEDAAELSRNGKHEYSRQIKNAVKRHNVYLDFVKFERGVTTIVVTMLTENEINTFLKKVDEKTIDSNTANGVVEVSESQANDIKLQIVSVEALISVLMELQKIKIVNLIMELPNAKSFQTYSYHINLLKQFMEQSKLARANLQALKPKGKEKHLSAHGTDFFSGYSKRKVLKNVNSANEIKSRSFHA